MIKDDSGRYYPEPGVAVRLVKEKVEELVIAQISRRQARDEK